MIKDNLKLFDHMVRFARQQAVPGEQLVPSAAVGDVEMRPDTKEEPGGQRCSVLNPSEQDYTLGAIMKAAGGGGGLIAGPKRNLDAIAAVRGHSGFLNDEKCIKRLRAQLDLAWSVSEIKSQERLAKKAKTDAATGELFDVAPRVLAKTAHSLYRIRFPINGNLNKKRSFLSFVSTSRSRNFQPATKAMTKTRIK